MVIVPRDRRIDDLTNDAEAEASDHQEISSSFVTPWLLSGTSTHASSYTFTTIIMNSQLPLYSRVRTKYKSDTILAEPTTEDSLRAIICYVRDSNWLTAILASCHCYVLIIVIVYVFNIAAVPFLMILVAPFAHQHPVEISTALCDNHVGDSETITASERGHCYCYRSTISITTCCQMTKLIKKLNEDEYFTDPGSR